MAAWIWTKDNIDDALLPELKEAMDEFIISDKTPFTCKKEIYNKLKANYCDMLNANDYFEVGFMKCDFLRSVKENDGILSRARIEERELIANYIIKFNRFMDDSVKEETIEEKAYGLERAIKEINNENFFVLRNSKEKIVSMAHYSVGNDGTAKIGLVYTPEEERGHGYAAKIVHDLTKIILNKGYTPILYTDQSFPNSNKAYYNAGYDNGGTLVNFTCNKSLLNEKCKLK